MKNKEFPLVTIGLTCYNAELTIIGAINSCFNQVWPNTEVIVVDDFSTDSSVTKIRDHINEKNVKFIKHKENKGYAGSVNSIINNASGDFITIFDNDDFSIKNRINLQYERLIKYEKKKKKQKRYYVMDTEILLRLVKLKLTILQNLLVEYRQNQMEIQ